MKTLRIRAIAKANGYRVRQSTKSRPKTRTKQHMEVYKHGTGEYVYLNRATKYIIWNKVSRFTF